MLLINRGHSQMISLSMPRKDSSKGDRPSQRSCCHLKPVEAKSTPNKEMVGVKGQPCLLCASGCLMQEDSHHLGFLNALPAVSSREWDPGHDSWSVMLVEEVPGESEKGGDLWESTQRRLSTKVK